MENIISSLQKANQLLQAFTADSAKIAMISAIADKLAEIFAAGGKVMICGNGGSATDAMHFAEEFTGKFRQERPALPAIALTDSSHITCVGNDFGFAEIFSRAVAAFGKPGDLLIGLSTSGNSANIIRALQQAQELGVHTCTLLGQTGGKLRDQADYQIIIPGETSDRIQEMHMLILHIIIEQVERQLYPENYR
ncbi:MAG: D-sedoheptulose 7-phosphate isomerase [Candidatus Cloacimonadales bacterium]